jgi:hypothetical protein
MKKDTNTYAFNIKELVTGTMYKQIQEALKQQKKEETK